MGGGTQTLKATQTASDSAVATSALHAALRILNEGGRVTPSLEIIRELIDQCPEALHVADADGCLPLHLACSSLSSSMGKSTICQCLNVVKLLVNRYPCALHVKDRQNNLPLHRAVHFSVQQQNLNNTLLHDTAATMVDFLIQQYPEALAVPDQFGDLVLHEACVLSHRFPYDMIARWIELYPEALAVPSQGHGMSLPLHCAVRMLEGEGGNDKYHQHLNQIELVHLLLDRCPNALKQKDEWGLLALHTACKCNASLELVQLLVQKCPQTLEMEDNHGELAIHWAWWHKSNNVGHDDDNNNNLQICEFLLSAMSAKAKLDLLRNGFDSLAKVDDLAKVRLLINFACPEGLSPKQQQQTASATHKDEGRLLLHRAILNLTSSCCATGDGEADERTNSVNVIGNWLLSRQNK